MMNVDNSDMDLGLSMGYSNQSVESRSNDNSGAGVNAGSMVDMAFVATNPLSELVWSPNKGLSLKCADCSLTDKRQSLLWDVGPSNMVLSSSDSVRLSNDNKRINEENLITTQVEFHRESEVAKDASLAKSPRSCGDPVFGSSHGHHTGTGGNMEEVIPVEGKSVVHFNQEQEEKSLCSPKNIPLGNIAETSETNAGEENRGTTESRPDNRERMINHSGKIEDVASGSRTLGLEIALASKVQKQCKTLDDMVSNFPSQGRIQTKLALVIEESKNKIEKLESTSENDVHHQMGEERRRRNKSVPAEASSSDSRIDLQKRKGKEKVLSDDRDVNERMSKDEDDSHGSMESCNSACLFSKGKKRLMFEQPLIVGSKKFKKQVQESPASASLVRHESSFMNWISNMVKGLPKSNQEEGGPPLALTLDHPNNELEYYDKKIITCNKTRDFGSGNMGFQTIFQSLYCPRIPNEDYPVGGSKELALADKRCGANITPISCRLEDDKSCKQFLVKIKNLNNSPCGSAGPSTQPPMKVLSPNIVTTQDITCKTNSAENKSLSYLACSKATDSSRGKIRAKSGENNSSGCPSDEKSIHYKDYRREALGSLWITRFSTRTPLLRSTDCTRLISQNHMDFPIDHRSSEARKCSGEDPLNVVGKELQNNVPSTEASIGFKRIRGHNYQKPIFRQNPCPSSQTFKISEAMASVFARRLDALKHIISSSSDVKNDVTRTRTTCFFCGRSGHDLRDCSEVKDNEVEDLLLSISSYDRAEEYPCLCIRCFQLDHWAIACPLASSKKTRTGTDDSFNLSQNTKMISDMGISSLEEVQKHIASRSGEKKLKENQITPLCNSVSKQISDAPKGIFDTIRKLRFSRTDILKWMNSHNSLSHLDGFFLRVRLGKWEGGLGGTGYYVACINGMQREISSKSSKNPIGVSIGGIKCLVESKYVSNNDFSEDELMAWWQITSKSGKIPTEDELKSKFGERKKLGF